MKTSFSPSVRMPDGSTVIPPNWVWLLAFARAGCAWAIKAIEENEPEFKRQMAWSCYLTRYPDYEI